MFKSHPDPSQWDDYVDYESTSWPKKERRRYSHANRGASAFLPYLHDAPTLSRAGIAIKLSLSQN